jgi:hypothetical protein
MGMISSRFGWSFFGPCLSSLMLDFTSSSMFVNPYVIEVSCWKGYRCCILTFAIKHVKCSTRIFMSGAQTNRAGVSISLCYFWSWRKELHCLSTNYKHAKGSQMLLSILVILLFHPSLAVFKLYYMDNDIHWVESIESLSCLQWAYYVLQSWYMVIWHYGIGACSWACTLLKVPSNEGTLYTMHLSSPNFFAILTCQICWFRYNLALSWYWDKLW